MAKKKKETVVEEAPKRTRRTKAEMELAMAAKEAKPKEKIKVVGDVINKPQSKEGSHHEKFLQLLKEMGVEFVEDSYSKEIMFKHPKTGISDEKHSNIVVFCFDYEGNFRYLG